MGTSLGLEGRGHAVLGAMHVCFEWNVRRAWGFRKCMEKEHDEVLLGKDSCNLLTHKFFLNFSKTTLRSRASLIPFSTRVLKCPHV